MVLPDQIGGEISEEPMVYQKPARALAWDWQLVEKAMDGFFNRLLIVDVLGCDATVSIAEGNAFVRDESVGAFGGI